MDNTYTIYLDGESFACASDTEVAYDLYSKVVAVAEIVQVTVDLVWNATREVVASYAPDELEEE